MSSRFGSAMTLPDEVGGIHREPLRRNLVARKLARSLKQQQASCCSRELDLVAHLHLEGRNVDLAAVHFHVSVANDLASLAARCGKTHAEGNVVQAALQLLQEQFAGDTLGARWPSRSRRGTGLRA